MRFISFGDKVVLPCLLSSNQNADTTVTWWLQIKLNEFALGSGWQSIDTFVC
jgi:hypothetical protein